MSFQTLPLLKDEDAGVRSASVAAVGALGAPVKPHFRRLIAALDDLRRSEVRAAAAAALAALGPVAAEAAPDLAIALKDTSSTVRQRAATAFGNFGERPFLLSAAVG